ncbi:MAG: histidine phosphatase family protein [Candidatus Pacebacteria bacterium]|nr:histidine phosphatase family protein [Candidatus Paceibacterota bacterium]
MIYSLYVGKLYVVRHGEIDYNIQGRYAGSVDVELNKKGIQQAHDTANKASQLNIDLIITSPLKRCTRMANIIQKVINVPVHNSNEFCERNVGVFEGLTREEAKKNYPELWAKNITRIYDDAPLGGETIKEVEKRVYIGLQKIKKKYNDKNTLIVTHAFVGKIIHKFFNEMNEKQFFEYKLDNAKVVEYNL